MRYIEIDSTTEEQDEVGVMLDARTGLVTVRNYETVLTLTPEETDTMIDKLTRARQLDNTRKNV